MFSYYYVFADVLYLDRVVLDERIMCLPYSNIYRTNGSFGYNYINKNGIFLGLMPEV